MSKATTLEKAIFLFNPIKPLSTPQELRDFPILKARSMDKALSAGKEMQELIGKLALLEYGLWCDVLPILKAEVEERAAKRAMVA